MNSTSQRGFYNVGGAWPHLLAVLADYAHHFEALYRDKLLEHGHRASAELLQSIHANVVTASGQIAVDVDLASHWQYVEWDTVPHWPPMDAILRWITVKPILPTPDSRGRIPTPRQLAYLIGRAMAGKSPNQANLKNPHGGTTGTHDLYDSVEQLNTEYAERIEAAITEDVGEMTDAILSTFTDTHTR